MNYADTIIRRSRLIMPANNKKFVEKAYLRNADSIVLDLEDSVPETEKLNTRGLIREWIPIAAKGGSDVMVRVNHSAGLLKGDIESSVWPGLYGIYIPKVESAEQVKEIEKILGILEEDRGMERGMMKLSITIETVKGYLNVNEIAQASNRIDSLTLGAEDFSFDSGIVLSTETNQAMLAPRMNVLFAARANGQIPLGLMGSIANFSDGNEIEENAKLAYKHGFLGASCIHPSNVETLNKCFSPSSEEIELAERIIHEFESSLLEGKAATKLDGKMIDTPHYEKAKQLMVRNTKIKKFELKKQRARENVISIGG